jgi:RNA polymerase sigma-70 factor (ECF subfamily)
VHLPAAANTPGTPMSDRDIDLQLVERVRQGDQRAFGILVEKYQRKLMRLLSRMVRDQHEVEDIAQEAFIKAYRALPQFRGDAAFYTWLYRIAVNTAKNYLSSRNRSMPTVSDQAMNDDDEPDERLVAQDISTPETELLSKQVAIAVNQAVDALPQELRQAITLREIEGMSYEEIADTMACPIGTVRSRIFRAREAIAAKLRPILGTPDDKRW